MLYFFKGGCSTAPYIYIAYDSLSVIFFFFKAIGRRDWSKIEDVPFIHAHQREGGLIFRTVDVFPNVLDVFKNAVVVPPLFHAFTKIQFYVISCFCRELHVTFRQFFDAMRAQTHDKSIHGRPFASGEARRAVSWAEQVVSRHGIVGVAPELSSRWMHLMQLLNEVQMVVYCKEHVRSELIKFRFYVITRLLMEAVRRAPSHSRKPTGKWELANFSKLNFNWSRHVYWANLVLGAPVFHDEYDVPLFLVMEEVSINRLQRNRFANYVYSFSDLEIRTRLP